MAANGSAYATLGLEPGADAAAVEHAYKRLIKQHHPDRAGGDARRAAEINRAYRELRIAGARNPLELETFDDRWTGANPWIRTAFALLLALLALVLAAGPVARMVRAAWLPQPPPFGATHAAGAGGTAEPMDLPLASSSIAAAVAEVRRMARDGDEIALAAASRECQRRFRADPAIKQFDRCAALDDAVIQLQDRDPLRDRGPFSELAVTGRQMNAGTLISNDYLAIDSRLDRIRVEVELAMVPPQPPVANIAD